MAKMTPQQRQREFALKNVAEMIDGMQLNKVFDDLSGPEAAEFIRQAVLDGIRSMTVIIQMSAIGVH